MIVDKIYRQIYQNYPRKSKNDTLYLNFLTQKNKTRRSLPRREDAAQRSVTQGRDLSPHFTMHRLVSNFCILFSVCRCRRQRPLHRSVQNFPDFIVIKFYEQIFFVRRENCTFRCIFCAPQVLYLRIIEICAAIFTRF